MGEFVEPIRDQVVVVGATATFECCLRHRCDVTWLVFPGRVKARDTRTVIQVLATINGVTHVRVLSE